MATTTINPEILAQRLEAAARRYEEAAIRAENDADERAHHLAHDFRKDAAESRTWAAAIRGANSLGWDGADIELIHD